MKKTRQVLQASTILLYVPNIIGYIRLLFLWGAYWNFSVPTTFLVMYGFSASLDFFDGWAARALDQKSSFGAWLDVIIDNLSRSLLWSNVVEWGWLVVCVEWLTFVCNHQAGSKWRDMNHSVQDGEETLQEITAPPAYVQAVMANGFKTALGTLVIAGLHVLPVWIYGMKTDLWVNLLPGFVVYTVLLLLTTGRLICLSVEIWCIYKHIRELLWEDQVTIIVVE